MPTTFSRRQVGDVTIIDISGQLTLSDGAIPLRDEICSLVRKGKTKVLLNLADTIRIDSVGIGELVSAFARLANHGAHLKLLGLTKNVRELLQMTKLFTVFEVFEDEEAAIRSFE